MVRRLLPLVAFVALFPVGCVQVTEPVGDIDKAEPDKALVGKWKHAEEEGTAFVIDIPEVKGNPKGLMRAVGVDKDKTEPIWFFVSPIGKKKFLNLCDNSENNQGPDFSKEGEYAKWAKSEHRAYWIVQYRVEKEEFIFNSGTKSEFKTIAEKAKLEQKGEFFIAPKDWLTDYITKNGTATIFPPDANIKLIRVKE